MANDSDLASRFIEIFHDIWLDKTRCSGTNLDGKLIAAAALLLIGIEPPPQVRAAASDPKVLPYIRAMFHAADAAQSLSVAEVQPLLKAFIEAYSKYAARKNSDLGGDLSPARILCIEGVAIASVARRNGKTVEAIQPLIPAALKQLESGIRNAW